jgi:hypothetical protein
MIPVPAPKWDEMVGEASEAAWVADRDRKAGLAAEKVRQIHGAREHLAARNALFTASPKVLQEVPFAADWYISLAGYSLKTLKQLFLIPRAAGLTRRADGVVAALREGRVVANAELDAFARWVNSEIGQVFPVLPSPDEAELRVALILGGRIVGIGQNVGGDDAVVLVKRLFVERLHELGCEVSSGGGYQDYEASIDLLKQTHVRFGGRLVCEFVSGGNRPDLKVLLKEHPVLVAEVKGRKDLSNVWESWMPQVADHMRTWRREFPDSARLFLGTLITRDMIEGRSARGTERTGLRQLHQDGYLTGAFNVSAVVEKRAPSVQDFSELMTTLGELASE